MLGDKESFVHGSITDGIFHGRIVTSKDAYYVENAKYYFPNQSHVDDGFHSVIYRDKHVNDPYREQRPGHANGCGLTDEISHWMEEVKNGGEEYVPPPPPSPPVERHTNETLKLPKTNVIDIDENPFKRYSKEVNTRSKRAAAARYQERNTCTLYIQTDPLIWRHIRESIPDVSSIYLLFVC